GAGAFPPHEPAAAELWAGGSAAEATGPGREVRRCGHGREHRLFQPGVQRVRLRRCPEPGRRALPLPLVRTADPCRRERGPDHRTATFAVYRVRVGHKGRSPSGGGTPLPGATSPAETGEIRARGEARRSEVDQSILQRLVRFGDVNVADKGCTTSRCSKAIIPVVDVLRSPIANTQRDEAMSRLIASFLVGLLLFGANAADRKSVV